MGADVRAGNAEGFGVAIGAGASVNIHGDVHYYPIQLKAPLRKVFQLLINNRSQLFGGRAFAFEKIADSIRSPGGGYLVATAPAGFGKTTLLANLVNGTPQAFAYPFFAPIYGEDTLSEEFFLNNVVQQMALWHDHNAQLPAGINDLRALYRHFVDEPFEARGLALKVVPYRCGRRD